MVGYYSGFRKKSGGNSPVFPSRDPDQKFGDSDVGDNVMFLIL